MANMHYAERVGKAICTALNPSTNYDKLSYGEKEAYYWAGMAAIASLEKSGLIKQDHKR